MKRSLYQILAILLVAHLFISKSEVSAQTYQILPLGNSITQGWGSLPVDQRVSYRLQLRTDLASNGHNINFIGHVSSGGSVLADSEHCGIPDTYDQNVLRLNIKVQKTL